MPERIFTAVAGHAPDLYVDIPLPTTRTFSLTSGDQIECKFGRIIHKRCHVVEIDQDVTWTMNESCTTGTREENTLGISNDVVQTYGIKRLDRIELILKKVIKADSKEELDIYPKRLVETLYIRQPGYPS